MRLAKLLLLLLLLLLFLFFSWVIVDVFLAGSTPLLTHSLTHSQLDSAAMYAPWPCFLSSRSSTGFKYDFFFIPGYSQRLLRTGAILHGVHPQITNVPQLL